MSTRSGLKDGQVIAALAYTNPPHGTSTHSVLCADNAEWRKLQRAVVDGFPEGFNGKHFSLKKNFPAISVQAKAGLP